MSDFVNPYTFVPFAARPQRGAPHGHHRLAPGHLSGRLRVSLTARTPLLVGGFGEVNDADKTPSEGAARVQDLPRRQDGNVIIPGSGVLGAVRALHEALTGSCLRVLREPDFTPVHRHPASTAVTDGMQLAVVMEVDAEDGRPTRLALASREVWVRQDVTSLADVADGALPRTGDRLRIDEGQIRPSGGRFVTEPSAAMHESSTSTRLDDSWVLLVTDTKARTEKRPLYFVAGKLESTAVRVDVEKDADAWCTYLNCVDGTDDARVQRQAHGAQTLKWSGQPPELTPACWPPNADDAHPAGYRLRARPYLYPGQPIWVRMEGAIVTELRLSHLWRRPGTGALSTRIDQAGPCSDPRLLCPSCRLFGSVDPYGRSEDDVSRQRAYRGHVRFEDAVAEGAVHGVPWFLAPLASPKPSAGQFYLDHTGVPQRLRLAEKTDAPAATWGSIADKGPSGARPIRGRKFYWRTSAPTEGTWPRGRRRDHHSDDLTRRVRLIPAGTRFVTHVSFDNIDAEQLGSLVACLRPGELFADRPDVVISIGGGKPFGFGAVSVEVQIEALDDARSRYLGQEAPTSTPEELVQRFQAGVSANVRAGWRDVAAVLTFGAIDDKLVWYPPGKGHKGSPKFDQGFDFWQKTAGVRLTQETRPLTGLPQPSDPQQVLDWDVAGTRPLEEHR